VLYLVLQILRLDTAYQNINELIDYKIEGDILFVTLLLEKEYGVKDVGLMIDFFIDYTKGKPHKLLVDAGNQATISVDGVRLIKYERTKSYASARAYVLTSFHQVIMARFYLRFKKQDIPTNYFKTVKEAKQWLDSITIK
jgi:hypothetical protein